MENGIRNETKHYYASKPPIIHRTNMVQGQILEREDVPDIRRNALAEHLVGKLCIEPESARM